MMDVRMPKKKNNLERRIKSGLLYSSLQPSILLTLCSISCIFVRWWRGGGCKFCGFSFFYSSGIPLELAAPTAFAVAAAVNYLLSIVFVFRHKAKWGNVLEIIIYCLVVLVGASIDLFMTKLLVEIGSSPGIAKIIAIALLLIFNFAGRRYVVFPLTARGEWRERMPRE
jgi:putative flippase GtrA